MSALKKRIRKIIRNPHDVSFEDLQNVLLSIGCEMRQPKGGSSHYIFKRKEDGVTLSVPKKKPVKENYVKKAIGLFRLEEYI